MGFFEPSVTGGGGELRRTRRPKFQTLVTPEPLHRFGRNLVFRSIVGCLFQISSQILLLRTFKISLLGNIIMKRLLEKVLNNPY